MQARVRAQPPFDIIVLDLSHAFAGTHTPSPASCTRSRRLTTVVLHLGARDQRRGIEGPSGEGSTTTASHAQQREDQPATSTSIARARPRRRRAGRGSIPTTARPTLVGRGLGCAAQSNKLEVISFARSRVTVLICGAIERHRQGAGRPGHPTTPAPGARSPREVNSPAFPDSPARGPSSTAERGAFTGGGTPPRGPLRRLPAGTLLDEIGEMPLPAQERLCACPRTLAPAPRLNATLPPESRMVRGDQQRTLTSWSHDGLSARTSTNGTQAVRWRLPPCASARADVPAPGRAP